MKRFLLVTVFMVMGLTGLFYYFYSTLLGLTVMTGIALTLIWTSPKNSSHQDFQAF